MTEDKDPFPNARDLSIHAGSTDLEETDVPEIIDEPWDEITAKHWAEIKGGLITIKEAYEKG